MDFSELSLTCTGPVSFRHYLTFSTLTAETTIFLSNLLMIAPLCFLLQKPDQNHRPALTDFVDWCGNLYLDLYAFKKKKKRLLTLEEKDKVLRRTSMVRN